MIWHRPNLYFPLMKLFSRLQSIGFSAHWIASPGAFRVDRIVSPNTEIVIEGFQRSANTFACIAFQKAQNRAVSMAHHLHVPAQIIQAIRLGIPTIVLIRHPVDAIISDLICGGNLRCEDALFKVLDWIKFYSSIKHLTNRFELATFDRVTSDFGSVIASLNQKFATSFRLFEHTARNLEIVYSAVVQAEIDAMAKGESPGKDIEQGVARPSAKLKSVKQAFLDQAKEDQQFLRAIQAAEKLYREFTGTYDFPRTSDEESNASF